MGIQDRDYYRKSPAAARQLVEWTRTSVGRLVALNVAVFIAQLVWPQDGLTPVLAAQANEVFSGHIWKLVTANFAHSTETPFHIFGNMLFLWVLGRGLEHIYGRLDFLILYLASGALAILAECLWNYVQAGGAQAHVSILGASGAVMAVTVLCALFYPHKTVGMWFVPPVPLWLLCSVYVTLDLFGVIHGETRVANVAHLAGGLVGLLYRVFDLRLKRVRLPGGSFNLPWRGWLSRRRREAGSRQGAEKIIAMPRRDRAADGSRDNRPRRETDPVYARVDELLGKISASGMDSLTGEELEFLKTNANRFRRDGES